MAMSAEEQKALLKKVYDKNKMRLEGIPGPLFMSPAKGEPQKMFQARKKKAMADRLAKMEKSGKAKFNKELSEGSDKKLMNLKKKR